MAGPPLDLLTLCPTNMDLFIETGTFRGETLQAALETGRFRELRSIELHQPSYNESVRRFLPHAAVHVYYGPSSVLLPLIVEPRRSTFFWLDAHKTVEGYDRPGGAWIVGTHIPNKECPLMEELDVILGLQWSGPFVVAVDDVGMFEDAFWETENSCWWSREYWPRMASVRAKLEDAGMAVERIGDRLIARGGTR